MAKNDSLCDFLKCVADKMRTKLGVTDLINPQDFDTKIDDIYAAGKQAQYDAFWDVYQNNGKSSEWGGYQFYGPWWNDSTFYPKYDIRPGGGDSRSTFMNNGVSNLRERIDGRGLKVVLLKGQKLVLWFSGAVTTEVPSMDTSEVEVFSEMFYNAKNLVTIPKINFSSATNLKNTFKGAESLENITIESTIKISIDFGDCPLSGASVWQVLSSLQAETSTDTRTVTFKSGCDEKFNTWAHENGVDTDYDNPFDYESHLASNMGNWTVSVL